MKLLKTMTGELRDIGNNEEITNNILSSVVVADPYVLYAFYATETGKLYSKPEQLLDIGKDIRTCSWYVGAKP